jgi:hypothetical protein
MQRKKERQKERKKERERDIVYKRQRERVKIRMNNTYIEGCSTAG